MTRMGLLSKGGLRIFFFPPALLKLVVRHNSRSIFSQQCLAINDKGISVYGPNKGLRRRLIHHLLYHERPLLDTFDSKVNSLTREPLGCPHTTWFWARPHGVSPRQTGCWVLRDQIRRPFDIPPAAAGSQDPEHAHAAPLTYQQMAWIRLCFTGCRL